VRKVEQRKKEGTSKLQEIMDRKNINDHELHEKSGVHFNTIRLIRTGEFKNPRFKTLRKLAKVLNCTAKDIGG
jgi:DNA-binding helix-turn-helix protein